MRLIPRVASTCRVCGTVFLVEARVIADGDGRYCSHQCAGRSKKRPADERFREKVDTSVHPFGCVWWLGRIDSNGYGHFNGGAGNTTAHRFAFLRAGGMLLPGEFACHNCDVNYPTGDISYRKCVNPAHLFAGNQRVNLEWMTRVGRRVNNSHHGEAHHRTVLTVDDVRAIRIAHTNGDTLEDIGRRHGVTGTNIASIVKRRTWRHVV